MKLKEKRNLEKIKKQKQKYPSITKKIIEASDIMLQVLDARFIQETRNLELEETIKKKEKKIINVINKSDLLDKKNLSEKQSNEIYPFVFVSCMKRKNIKKLRDLIKIEAKKINKENYCHEKPQEQYIIPLRDKEKINIGVIGYPNTGKSSLINILTGKASAGTGAEAGFTKGFQKIRLTPNINLIDTPGIIPKNIYSEVKKQELSQHTKLGGRSYSQVKEPEIIVSELMKEYRGVFENFYDIKAKGDPETLTEKLGKRKGFLIKKGEVNSDKTARLILKDWQEGKIKVNNKHK